MGQAGKKEKVFGVLIETYWNVNRGIRRCRWLHEYRINRNILECKYNKRRLPNRKRHMY